MQEGGNFLGTATGLTGPRVAASSWINNFSSLAWLKVFKYSAHDMAKIKKRLRVGGGGTCSI